MNSRTEENEAKRVKLWLLCEKFIKDQRISCPEATCEDRVYEHAYELVGDICDIVGYHQNED